MINKRIFGSDINVKLKKILEARQLAASQTRGPNEEIKPSQYPDDRDTYYTFNELVPNDFDGVADLSSRTPFVRMWTAVELVTPEDVIETLEVFKPGEDEFSKKDARNKADLLAEKNEGSRVVFLKTTDYPNGAWFVQKDIIDPEGEVKETHDSKIYEVNNNLYNPFDLNESTESTEQTLANFFPNQNIDNPFLKPAAGITSVSSETQDQFGLRKSTTIRFTVFNFQDFEKIYNKYFLRPGAQVFVDFGWSSLPSKSLYNPQDLIDSGNVKTFLYGETSAGDSQNGILTENIAHMDVIPGIVTNYDAKIKEDGTIECELTLMSGNSALLSMPINENTTMSIENTLDHAIKYLAINPLISDYNENQGMSEADIAQISDIPDGNATVEEIKQFNANVDYLASKLLSGTQYTPGNDFNNEDYTISSVHNNSIRTGVYINDKEADKVYISWGLFEDLIINSQFGFGNGIDTTRTNNIQTGDNIQIRLDSTNSFSLWHQNFVDYQKSLVDSKESPPTHIYPEWWGMSSPDEEENSVNHSYSAQTGKIPDYSDADITGQSYGRGGVTQTDWDKEKGRIPIREIFVSGEEIIKSFRKSNTVKEALKDLLDKMNETSFGSLNLTLKTGNIDSELAIVDANRLDIEQKIRDAGSAESDKNEQEEAENGVFDKIFEFDVTSPSSIVKSYDVSFTIPDGDIGNMYAIQNMTHGHKMIPVDNVLDNSAALSSLTDDNLSVRYKPSNTSYRGSQISSDDTGFLVQSYKNAKKLLSSQTYKIEGERTNEDLIEESLLQDTTGIDALNYTESDAEETEKTKDSGGGGSDARFARAGERGLIDSQYKGKRVANSETEYYQMTQQVKLVKDHIPNILPIKLNLTIYGTSQLETGDIFKVNYLPESYKSNVYFQVIKVTNNISPSGWDTSFETVFRIRPTKKGENVYNSPSQVPTSSETESPAPVILNPLTVLTDLILNDTSDNVFYDPRINTQENPNPDRSQVQTMTKTNYQTGDEEEIAGWVNGQILKNTMLFGGMRDMEPFDPTKLKTFRHVKKVFKFRWDPVALGNSMLDYTPDKYGITFDLPWIDKDKWTGILPEKGILCIFPNWGTKATKNITSSYTGPSGKTRTEYETHWMGPLKGYGSKVSTWKIKLLSIMQTSIDWVFPENDSATSNTILNRPQDFSYFGIIMEQGKNYYLGISNGGNWFIVNNPEHLQYYDYDANWDYSTPGDETYVDGRKSDGDTWYPFIQFKDIPPPPDPVEEEEEEATPASAWPGCTDATATNFVANATEDDGSCLFYDEECTACNGIEPQDSIAQLIAQGCIVDPGGYAGDYCKPRYNQTDGKYECMENNCCQYHGAPTSPNDPHYNESIQQCASSPPPPPPPAARYGCTYDGDPMFDITATNACNMSNIHLWPMEQEPFTLGNLSFNMDGSGTCTVVYAGSMLPCVTWCEINDGEDDCCCNGPDFGP